MRFVQNFIHAFFFFPGTFLHELLHLLAAMFTIAIGSVFNMLSRPFGVGAISTIRITSFNILPNFKTGVYGSVAYEGGGSFTHIFVSSAPKIAWVFLFFFLQSYGLLHLSSEEISGEQSMTFMWGQLGTAQLLIGIYASLQFLWAGSLSRQDWHNIFSALGDIAAIGILIGIIIYMLMSISGVGDLASSAWDALGDSTDLANTIIDTAGEKTDWIKHDNQKEDQ